MKACPSACEAMLWSLVRDGRLGLRCQTQVILHGFIVDFLFPSIGLIVETDGSQHERPEAKAYDRARDRILASYGYQTLRYSARKVLHSPEAVLCDIQKHVKNRSSAVSTKSGDSSD